jgi:hypothetical protein
MLEAEVAVMKLQALKMEERKPETKEFRQPLERQRTGLFPRAYKRNISLTGKSGTH